MSILAFFTKEAFVVHDVCAKRKIKNKKQKSVGKAKEKIAKLIFHCSYLCKKEVGGD